MVWSFRGYTCDRVSTISDHELGATKVTSLSFFIDILLTFDGIFTRSLVQ